MSQSPPKKKGTHTFSVRGKAVRPLSPAPVSQLRAQTRKVLAKHYRAKYGVR
jgi:hypothetical protein